MIFRPVLTLTDLKDTDLYRSCGVFERAMSFSSSQGLTRPCTEKVIHLLYRCTFTGGSTMLVTRCGVLSWIKGRTAKETSLDSMLSCLVAKILDTCDASRLRAWSGMNANQMASVYGRKKPLIMG